MERLKADAETLEQLGEGAKTPPRGRLGKGPTAADKGEVFPLQGSFRYGCPWEAEILV